MAEHEIIKHTKKAYTILKSSNMSFKNKKRAFNSVFKQ
jgi:hypothetical protein